MQRGAGSGHITADQLWLGVISLELLHRERDDVGAGGLLPVRGELGRVVVLAGAGLQHQLRVYEGRAAGVGQEDLMQHAEVAHVRVQVDHRTGGAGLSSAQGCGPAS